MPLVTPLPTDHDPEIAAPAQFCNTTLGLTPSSALTMLRRPALARAFTEPNRAVTPAVGDALRHHWDDGEIVELTCVVALFGFLNRWNDAMGTELEAPAAADGQRWLAPQGWTAGKHGAPR